MSVGEEWISVAHKNIKYTVLLTVGPTWAQCRPVVRGSTVAHDCTDCLQKSSRVRSMQTSVGADNLILSFPPVWRKRRHLFHELKVCLPVAFPLLMVVLRTNLLNALQQFLVLFSYTQHFAHSVFSVEAVVSQQRNIKKLGLFPVFHDKCVSTSHVLSISQCKN